MSGEALAASPALQMGPFLDVEAAIAAKRAQGLFDVELVGMPSGAWYLTEPRHRSVRCGGVRCHAQTWSSTGFCGRHLEAHGFGVDPAARRTI